MIKEFIEKFMSNKEEIEAIFQEKHPEDYKEIVKEVIKIISLGAGYNRPDPERIHEIDDGDYQGTLVYIIAAKGYQPDDYWYVKISYGSCSGCDTLESIRSYSYGKPSKDQVHDYMVLALHIVQGIRKMDGES